MLIRTAVFYGAGPGFAIDLSRDCEEKIEAAFQMKDVEHLLAVSAVAVGDKTGLWETVSTDLQLFTPMDADPVVLGGDGWIIHLFPDLHRDWRAPFDVAPFDVAPFGVVPFGYPDKRRH